MPSAPRRSSGSATELTTAQDTVAELRARLELESAEGLIEHSVNVLTTAQETADKILAQADHQRDRVERERLAVLAEARETAVMLSRDSQRRAQQITDAATRQVAALEQEIARLTLSADAAQSEIDRESAHLEATIQISRAQLDDAIDGILEHLVEQFGKAHPLSAQTAITRRQPVTQVSSRQTGTGRSRRGLRVAGRPADRLADQANGVSSRSSAVRPVPDQQVQD